MVTVKDIKERLEVLRVSDFKIGKIQSYHRSYQVCKTLRNALILDNDIYHIISKEGIQNLCNELDEIMKAN